MLMSNGNGEKLRDEFYQAIQKETGLERKIIRQVLEAQGLTKFDPAKVNEYRATVLAHLALRRKLISQVLESKPPVEPCPVPGCTGVKVRSWPWPWLCSVGGLRHHLVIRTAGIALGPEAPFEAVQERSALLLAKMETLGNVAGNVPEGGGNVPNVPETIA